MDEVMSAVVETLGAWANSLTVITVWTAVAAVAFAVAALSMWRVVSHSASSFGVYLLGRRLRGFTRLPRSQVVRALQTLVPYPRAVFRLMRAAPGRDRFLAAYAVAAAGGFSRPACDAISAVVGGGGNLDEMAGFLSSTGSLDEAVSFYKSGIPLEYAAAFSSSS